MSDRYCQIYVIDWSPEVADEILLRCAAAGLSLEHLATGTISFFDETGDIHTIESEELLARLRTLTVPVQFHLWMRSRVDTDVVMTWTRIARGVVQLTFYLDGTDGREQQTVLQLVYDLAKDPAYQGLGFVMDIHGHSDERDWSSLLFGLEAVEGSEPCVLARRSIDASSTSDLSWSWEVSVRPGEEGLIGI